MTALEHFLLRAYLDGELNADERDAFELLMLERPDIAELVDADTALSLGLAESALVRLPDAVAPVATQKQPDTNTRPTTDSGSSGGSSAVIAFPRRPQLPYLAAAASVLLALGVGTGALLRPSPDPLSAAEVVYVDKTRSLSTIPKIAISPNRALILLVPVASVEPCVADIELRQVGSTTLRAQATPDEFGYASLVLAVGGLKPGRAAVVVRCGINTPAEYPVELELQARAP